MKATRSHRPSYLRCRLVAKEFRLDSFSTMFELNFSRNQMAGKGISRQSSVGILMKLGCELGPGVVEMVQ
jgi:hypothetical protein